MSESVVDGSDAVGAAFRRADHLLWEAIRATEEARACHLHHSAPDPEPYEGFLHAIEQSSRLWNAADGAWKEYDSALASLRGVTGKSNEELWTISQGDPADQLALGLSED
jgi:hypothetical protein